VGEKLVHSQIEDLYLYTNMLRHADVGVNVASTFQ